MEVYLIDGTYELFRYFYALPSARDESGDEIGGMRGVVTSVLQMVSSGATHVAVATDHVIESFRNDLWPGYKTGAGIDPDLLAQFAPLEAALQAAGIVVWPMVEFEADDALAAAAAACARDPRVDRVVICTPDKDLAQCVSGSRVVQLNRRTRVMRDEAGVKQKFGVTPESIPDYLALVGDAADGYPGIAGIGPVGAARLLNSHGVIENFPAALLGNNRELALLFKRLATLRADEPLFSNIDELRWRGPAEAFTDFVGRLGEPRLLRRCRAAANRI